MADLLKGLLQWDRMLATKLIKGFYIWGLVVWGLIGAGLVLTSLGLFATHGVIMGLIALLFTLGLVVCAVISLRVTCELALLFFLMHENLADIRNVQVGVERGTFPVNVPSIPVMQAHLPPLSSR